MMSDESGGACKKYLHDEVRRIILRRQGQKSVIPFYMATRVSGQRQLSQFE
jgi:hypothetical protein